ncbi:MAG: ABC transporter substrate-binding protein/permease [Proteobacteria bacterium]|nr:ABC transporter substrate-binding protein/permease [Pseudomonadota bacterium]
MKRAVNFTILIVTLFLIVASSQSSESSLERVKKRGYLLWGTDAEGGAPYAFPDPGNPDKLIGFEIDLAEAIGRELGVKIRYVQNAWDSLIPALERGDFDIAVNGIEITPQRLEKVIFTKPYYVYTLQTVVRLDDNRISDFNDLKGKKVGTLQGAVSHSLLQELGGVDIKVYSGVVEPYEDLALGRLDAVFLDSPIAGYYAKPNKKLKYVGTPIGEGLYGMALRKEDKELRDEIDKILMRLISTGELKKIYEKWNLWDKSQEKLYKYAKEYTGESFKEEIKSVSALSFIPALFKGALVTIGVSVASMIVAIILGLTLALMKVYMRPPFSYLASAYIEFFRGTPLLIQLYILYYGLPNIGISLNPLTAAILGLGMNYASYEAELYRAGISAIPKGQLEAGLSLGMSNFLAVRRIVLPQAIKIALPGITNDFIALFKDSSLVSIIAMVELTKSYTILAATTMKFFELGLIVAFLYFAMSYPLSLLSKRLEERLKKKKR